jgi:tetratricopeptide (TPR) repeat protein
MSDLLIGLLSALMATNPPMAVSNLVTKKTGLTVTIPNPNDPVEKEYLKLLTDDDAAQAAVDEWIKDNDKFKEKGAGVEAATLRVRVQQRLDTVKKSYETFLLYHPDHARARLAYGSFLNDIGEEELGRDQWEKAREQDPTNPAAWNNLANWYGHNSPVTKAFEYYGKAIELNPNESVYYENLATTVYLYRHDATNYYQISEPQAFAKAMDLYRKALDLDPDNFLLATRYAESYYGFMPAKSTDAEINRRQEQKRFEEAMGAWQRAWKLARDDIERQGVQLHFARWQINIGRFADARQSLGAVTNEMYATTKRTLTKKLDNQENKSKGTNAPAAPLGK